MDDNKTALERRQYVRVPRNIRVDIAELTYPLPEPGGSRCIGKDISEGGLCLLTGTGFPPETVLRVEFHISGWEKYRKRHALLIDVSSKSPVTVIGRVAWCLPAVSGEGYEVGIRFTDIYEDDRAALLTYLNQVVEEVDNG